MTVQLTNHFMEVIGEEFFINKQLPKPGDVVELVCVEVIDGRMLFRLRVKESPIS